MQGIFPQPLLYSEMACYAVHNGLGVTIADLEEFVDIMTALDAVYFKHAASKRKS